MTSPREMDQHCEQAVSPAIEPWMDEGKPEPSDGDGEGEPEPEYDQLPSPAEVKECVKKWLTKLLSVNEGNFSRRRE